MPVYDGPLYDETMYDDPGGSVPLSGQTGGQGSGGGRLTLRARLYGLTGGQTACCGELGLFILPAPAPVRAAPWLRPGG